MMKPDADVKVLIVAPDSGRQDFFYAMRRRHTRCLSDWSSDVCSSDLPREERGDLLRNYYRRLIDPDPAVHMPAARAWSIYEGSCSTLLPSSETVAYFAGDVVALGLARIERSEEHTSELQSLRHLVCRLL